MFFAKIFNLKLLSIFGIVILLLSNSIVVAMPLIGAHEQPVFSENEYLSVHEEKKAGAPVELHNSDQYVPEMKVQSTQNIGGDIDYYQRISDTSTESLKSFSGISLNYDRFDQVSNELKIEVNNYINSLFFNGEYFFKHSTFYLVEYEFREDTRRLAFFNYNNDIPDTRPGPSQYLVVYQDVPTSTYKLCDGYFEGRLGQLCLFDRVMNDEELAAYAQEVPNSEYKLPWRKGESYAVSQDMTTNFSHDNPYNYYALDFAMYEGAHLTASRGGTVVSAYDGSNQGGIGSFHCSRWVEFTNYVVINHGDGTSGVYVHLEQDSLQVEVGDVVNQGDYIARAGNTGCSSGSHLHFAIQSEVDRDYGNSGGGWLRRSVPFSFSSPDVIVSDQYGFTFFPFSYESSNGEYRFSQFDRIRNYNFGVNTRGDATNPDTACGSVSYTSSNFQLGLILDDEPIKCGGLLRWKVRWDSGNEGWVAQNSFATNLLQLDSDSAPLIMPVHCSDFPSDIVCAEFFIGTELPSFTDPVLRAKYQDFGMSYLSREPHPVLGQENYSLRMTGIQELEPGWYSLSAVSSGGVLVTVADIESAFTTVIEEWNNTARNTFESEPIYLSGDTWVESYFSHGSGDQEFLVTFNRVDTQQNQAVYIQSVSDTLLENDSVDFNLELQNILESDVESIEWIINGVSTTNSTLIHTYEVNTVGPVDVEVVVTLVDTSVLNTQKIFTAVASDYEVIHEEFPGVILRYNELNSILDIDGAYPTNAQCKADELDLQELKPVDDKFHLVRTTSIPDSTFSMGCSMAIEQKPINLQFDVTLTPQQLSILEELVVII
jgi:murein DD-endopeptidase MepM/ murein hydrolase activator NlpD